MLSVLIIGCGNIAGGFDAERTDAGVWYTHAGAYVANGGFSLLACVDPDEARRTAFHLRWGVKHAFASLAAVLDAGLSFDVVSVCSPTSWHASDLHAVLNLRPRLVFCEKPLTSSLRESECLTELYREAGIPLLVNYTRRWDARVRSIVSELRSLEWGDVRSASAVYNKGLFNNGSHMLDLLSQLLGPLSVLSAGPGFVDMWEEDPSVPAMLSSASGAVITLNYADARDYSLFELELVTERGTIAMENGGLDWQLRRASPSSTFRGYQSLGPRVHLPGALGGATMMAVSEIQQVVAHGQKPSCTADDAISVQRLCESIREL